MTRSSFRSHAKVNLHLQVVGRRPDGYHELRTVFQMIDLHDSVEIVVAERGEVQLTVDAPGLSSGPDNLAWKAAATFRDRWAPGAGIHLRLRKRIPLGAGLGGGSSNAATVLRALDRMWDLGLGLDLHAPARVEQGGHHHHGRRGARVGERLPVRRRDAGRIGRVGEVYPRAHDVLERGARLGEGAGDDLEAARRLGEGIGVDRAVGLDRRTTRDIDPVADANRAAVAVDRLKRRSARMIAAAGPACCPISHS